MSMKIGNTNVFIMFKNIKKLRKHVINISTQFGNLYDFAFKVGGGDAPPLKNTFFPLSQLWQHVFTWFDDTVWN